MGNISLKNSNDFISDYAVLIKKMRLIKKLTRQQAGVLFDFSVKNLERLENGRGNISVEKFREFREKYGFTELDIDAMKAGKFKVEQFKTPTKNRPDRRFCHRRISRECKVLKELRLLKKLDQYSASKLCGLGKNTIGFIENGRVTLTEKKILQITNSYGFTLEYFNQLLKVSPLRHEMVEQCQQIISSMDENKLRIIMPMLQSMNN